MKTGRLEKLDLQTIWPREDTDFTPWLAKPENLALLAESLDLGSLDAALQEVSIGNFWADIVCRDSNDDVVVIENQIRKSDHTHLGQLLTYLAGSEAQTIIWITKTMRDEHRAALEWLNENTARQFAFFGVELEAWRIGDSAPAPKFEVVCRPNDWVRAQKQKAAGGSGEDYQGRMAYWDAFLQNWNQIEGLSPPPRGPNQGWMKLAFSGEFQIPGQTTGIYLYRRIGELVGVYLSIGKPDRNDFEDWLKTLDGFPSLIEGSWEINRRGLCQCFKTLDADALDETDWTRQHGWMQERVLEFFQDWRSGLCDNVGQLLRTDEGTGEQDNDAGGHL